MYHLLQRTKLWSLQQHKSKGRCFVYLSCHFPQATNASSRPLVFLHQEAENLTTVDPLSLLLSFQSRYFLPKEQEITVIICPRCRTLESGQQWPGLGVLALSGAGGGLERGHWCPTWPFCSNSVSVVFQLGCVLGGWWKGNLWPGMDKTHSEMCVWFLGKLTWEVGLGWCVFPRKRHRKPELLLPGFPSGRLSPGIWLPLSTGEAHQLVWPGDSGLVMLEGAMGWTWAPIPALSPPSGWNPACLEFSTGRVRFLSKISCCNHFQKLCKTTISRS